MITIEAVAKPPLHVDAFVAKPPLHVDAFVSNASKKDGFLHIDAIETIASRGLQLHPKKKQLKYCATNAKSAKFAKDHKGKFQLPFLGLLQTAQFAPQSLTDYAPKRRTNFRQNAERLTMTEMIC